MPNVVLSYFNLKGLGQGIRMLLAYGDQEFEDRRFEIDEWEQHKAKYPFRQLPVLEIDGKQYAQSHAICRYFGHKYGVAGASLEEDLEIDQNIDFFGDIRMKGMSLFMEKDPDAKKRKAEEFWEVNGWMFDKLDEIIKTNNGHLACGKLTWADFMFAGVYDALKFILQSPHLDDKYPSFKKLQQTVVALPKVKEFVAKCPPSDK